MIRRTHRESNDALLDAECDDEEKEEPCMPGRVHDYRVVKDWIGDPNVINGTYSWVDVRCRHCCHVLEGADPLDYIDDCRE